MQERPEHFSINAPPLLALEDRWMLSRLQKTLAAVKDRIERYRLNEALLSIYDFIWHDYCDWYLELIKPRLYDNPDELNRQGTLALALRIFESALRALHPFMPFVTEELWQQMASLEGLDIGALAPHSVMRQKYPEAEETFFDSGAEERMALLQIVIQSVRNVRAEMGVPPKTAAPLLISCSPEEFAILQSQPSMLSTLARVSRLEQVSSKPIHAASALAGSLEIYVPLEGLIDLDVERKRLEKEISRHEGFLKGIAAKLSNSDFVGNAPAEIVARERQKQTDVEATLEKLRRNRRSLD
jgi:valyl-tRNA synthetase